jgi:hypothetical protein
MIKHYTSSNPILSGRSLIFWVRGKSFVLVISRRSPLALIVNRTPKAVRLKYPEYNPRAAGKMPKIIRGIIAPTLKPRTEIGSFI